MERHGVRAAITLTGAEEINPPMTLLTIRRPRVRGTPAQKAANGVWARAIAKSRMGIKALRPLTTLLTIRRPQVRGTADMRIEYSVRSHVVGYGKIMRTISL